VIPNAPATLARPGRWAFAIAPALLVLADVLLALQHELLRIAT